MPPPDTRPGGQTAFAAAIRDAEAPVPAGIRASRASPTAPAGRRFAIYRNNVVVGLVDALARRFPAVQALVGEAFFRAMARVFVTEHPPRSRIVTMYGDALPDFIAGFPPAASLPYLADVARLEAALTHAYHAADAEPLGLERLAELAPDALSAARLGLHPAVRIVASRFPIVTLHEQNAGSVLGPTPDMSENEAALVVRPSLDVAVHRLPPGGALFATRLRDATLGAAAEEAAGTPGFDLSACLATLFTAGAIAAITVAPETRQGRPT